MNNGWFKPKPFDLITAAKILRVVCNYFETTEADLKGRGRKGAMVKARQTCYWLLYKYAGENHKQIGKYMDRDHTNILYAVAQVDHAIKHETYVHADAKKLKAQVEKWLNHPWKYSNQTLANYTMKSLLERKVNKHLTAA